MTSWCIGVSSVADRLRDWRFHDSRMTASPPSYGYVTATSLEPSTYAWNDSLGIVVSNFVEVYICSDLCFNWLVVDVFDSKVLY